MYPEPPNYEPGNWQSDVALFIDWENLKLSLHTAERTPNLSALMETVNRYGRLVVARAYADWEDPFHLDSRDQFHLYEAGIEPVYVPCRADPNRPERRKNSVDVKMSADCMEVSFTNQHINTYVLVSGDADFIHLANSLRSRGNRVTLIGVSWSTSSRFAERVDELLIYDRDIEDGGRRPAPAPAYRSTPVRPQEDLDQSVEALATLIREQREEGRYPLLSWLGHQLRRQLPGFNPQVYGFEKFKDFVRYAEQNGSLRIVTQGLVDWALLPDEEIPESVLEDLARYGAMGPSGIGAPGAERPPLHAVDNPLEEYEDVFEDVVRTAHEIELDDRYEFMTPGFLGQCLWRKGHWDPETLPPGAAPASDTLKSLRAGQIRKFVDHATEAGLLRQSLRTDMVTGKNFAVVNLNFSNPFVEDILARPQREPGQPMPESDDLPDEETDDDEAVEETVA